MLRFHLDNKATPLGSCKQLKNVREGFCFNRALNLVVRSTPQGYYVEDKMFLISDRRPAIVRDDMPAIRQVSLQELTDDKDVLALGCGLFQCEYGDVKVSMFPGRIGLYIDIVSSTVIRFNATIEALRNGELKPVGSEQTVVEILRTKVKDLEIQFAESDQRKNELHVELTEVSTKLLQRSKFLHEIDEFLLFGGTLPTSPEESPVSKRIVSKLDYLKKRTWWQRLWS